MKADPRLAARLEEAEHNARRLADLLPEVADLAYAPGGQDYEADRVTGTKDRKKPPPTEDRDSANTYRAACRELAHADLTLARALPGYTAWGPSAEVAHGHLSLNVAQSAQLARRVAAVFKLARKHYGATPGRFSTSATRGCVRATDAVWRAYSHAKPYGGAASEQQKTTHQPGRRRRDLEARA